MSVSGITDSRSADRTGTGRMETDPSGADRPDTDRPDADCAGSPRRAARADAALGAAPPWLAALFAAIDARDAQAFAAFLTADCEFRFGNAPVVVGREAIAAAVAGFFQAIAGCRHRLLGVWRDGERLAMHGEVRYTRLDGREVTVPFANVFALRGELVAAYLIYIDNTPLFAP